MGVNPEIQRDAVWLQWRAGQCLRLAAELTTESDVKILTDLGRKLEAQAKSTRDEQIEAETGSV